MVSNAMGDMVRASGFLRDLMKIGRSRYGGPQFTFPDTDAGRAHAIMALRYAIRADYTSMPDQRALSWAHLWSPWMLSTWTPYWDTSTLDPAIAEALREPPSFDGAKDAAAIGLTPEETRDVVPRYVMPGFRT